MPKLKDRTATSFRALLAPDIILAILGLAFALILTLWLVLTNHYPVFIVIGIIAFLACTAYLLMKKPLSPSALVSLSQVKTKPTTYVLLNALFFLLLAYSIVSVYLRPDLYARPVDYFICITLMTVILAVEVLFLPKKRWYHFFILLKIIFIALSLEWSQQLIFSGVVGLDPWWHQGFTQQILDSGHVPEGEWYSKMPLHHLMVAATSLVTGLDYKMSTMLSVGISHVVCILTIVYLLGRFIYTSQVGLLAALFLGVANHRILFGYLGIPNTTGIIFILIIIYLLFKIRRESPIIAIILSLILMGTLILTHTVASTFLVVLLFLFWLGFKAYNRLYREKGDVPVSFGLATLFTVATLSYWIYVSGHITRLAEMIRTGFGYEGYWSRAPIELSPFFNAPLSEQIFSWLGFFLFCGFSLFGGLLMMSKKFGTRYSLAMALGGLALLALGVLPMVTGASVLEDRWWYASQVMLAIAVSIALLSICSLFRSNLVKISLLATLSFILCFVMVMSPQANFDNPVFTKDVTARYGFTEAEFQAMQTLSTVQDAEIGTDTYYSWLRWVPQFHATIQSVDEELQDEDFTNFPRMLIVIREEIVHQPRHGFLKLDYDPRLALDEQGFSRVYDCGSVSAFYK